MPRYEDMPIQTRRALHVFYVLDTSTSMRGLPIQSLNRALEETLETLKRTARTNANARVQVAVLQFGSECSWLQPNGPEDADQDFLWQDISVVGGTTNIGVALEELNTKLSREGFLKADTGALLPVIIFMTDGCTSGDYEQALARIMQNKYFTEATRVGFAIGEDPDVDMIARLVGSPKAVIRSDDLDVFANMLRFVSQSASQGASVAHGMNHDFTGSMAVNRALDMAGATRTNEGMVEIPEGWKEDMATVERRPTWEEPDPSWT